MGSGLKPLPIGPPIIMALNGGAWEKSISLSLNNEGEVSAYCQSILLAYSRILDPQTSPQERTEHEKVNNGLYCLATCCKSSTDKNRIFYQWSLITKNY